MGDMNDGVTRDIVDESYLLHSIVHELRGAFHHELALMRHVLRGKQLQRKGYAWTVEFKDPAAGGKHTRVLLDHIIFSPACHAGGAPYGTGVWPPLHRASPRARSRSWRRWNRWLGRGRTTGP